MLISGFTTPRRLAVLGIFVFFAILVLIRNSQYSSYLPKYDFHPAKPDAPPEKPNPDWHDYPPEHQDKHGDDLGDDPVFPGEAVQQQHDAIEGQHKATEEQNKVAEEQHKAAEEQHNAAEEEHSAGLEQPTAAASQTIASTNIHSPSPKITHSPSTSFAAPVNTSTPVIASIAHSSYEETQKKIKEFIQWTPPKTPGHWPSWDAYKNKDYDPNRWEGLDYDAAFYTKNGVERLEKQNITAAPYLPYPKYNSAEWKEKWRGRVETCTGPRGLPLDDSVDDMVLAYRRLPDGFPQVTLNDAGAMGLDEDVCFDRIHRYGPYGLGKTGQGETAGKLNQPSQPVDWSAIYWGQLQDQCLERNKDRFGPDARRPMNTKPTYLLPKEPGTAEKLEWSDNAVQGQKYHPRTAVLIRAWEGYAYTENDLQNIRALITELSLLSAGEYQVYLLVNVKERNADIYSNQQVYQDILKRVVPQELRDITILWTESVLEHWYPQVGDWQVYWSQFMPLQWFSKTHPQFDYIWNWETDARYTGNHYHFLEKAAEFAKKMPRKNLWERNSRFYFPSAHGSYSQFLNDTDAIIATATKAGNMTAVWGPQPYAVTQIPHGPKPPRPEREDDFVWGVDEEADLITLQPIWDPSNTEWSHKNKIWNFVNGVRPQFTTEDPKAENFTHPNFANIPRRAFINGVARFSRKMLNAMHAENLAGRNMQADMWPATVALHHGLKAVYAPHPVWTDRKWPAWYLDAVFNADGGVAGQWGQQKDSPYNHDREANFRGWGWYYQSVFPKVLYRRWLGWKAEDGLGSLGGKEYEEQTAKVQGVGEVGGHGRMCLPGMLLHPVKQTKEIEDPK